MEIFYLVADFHACGWYRCHTPGMELNKRGHHVMLHDKLPMEHLPMLDVIIFQRQCDPYFGHMMDEANALGKTTVFELDDDLWNIHPTNPGYKFWHQTEVIRGLEECIRKAKVVTTTTPALAKILNRFNKNVHILPNMLPAEEWQVKKKRKRNKIVIGWAGSKHHWTDLLILRGILDQILNEYPNVEFQIVGPEYVPFMKHERMIALDPVAIEDYAKLLSGFDIGLAPLDDSQFNKGKSDLKFLEYAMAGLAVVASKVDSYSNTIIHGETGFLANNNKDWLKYIKRLVEDEKLRTEMQGKAKKYAETRTIEKNIHLWEEAYGLK